MNLKDAVDQLMRQYTDGTRSIWTKRLDDPSRYECFKLLVRDRGSRYAGASFDNYETPTNEQRMIVAELKKLAASEFAWCREGGGLVLYGPQGTGKDHLLFSLLRDAIIDCGFSVVWRDGLRLQDEIRKAIGDGCESDLRRKMQEPHILAISDPLPPDRGGASDKGLSEWNLAWLRDVIDRRYSDCKSTWITFNGSTTDALKASLTPMVAGRLLDGSQVFFCNWPSYRQPLRVFNAKEQIR